MKQLILIASFFTAMLSAQTHRFIYDYKYVPDPAKKDSVVEEAMALDITDKGSKFHSYVKLQADSILQAQIQEQMKSGNMNMNLKGTKMGTVRYSVTKDYPDFKMFLTTELGTDQYKVEDNRKLNWVILDEKENVGKYTAQKATTTFGGREWTAWFTTDLPFQDGPFKFHGLPGLIVKLEDKAGAHKFVLNGNKIIAEENKNSGVAGFRMSRNTISVNHDQFMKAYKNYVADPSRSYRQMFSGSSNSDVKVINVRTTMDGKEISQKDVISGIEKTAKSTQKANENFIDLEFFKISKK